MDKIKVLWMNNGEEDAYSVITEALECGVVIENCNSFKECRKLLSSEKNNIFDAVILNAFCKMITELPKPDNLEKALDWLGRECPRIPVFVVNTKKDLEEKDRMKLSPSLKAKSMILYSVPDSNWELLNSIHEKVYSLPHHKYAKELCICREQERVSLLNILWKFQEENNVIEKDHTIPTECRKVLEGIKKGVSLGEIHIPSIDKPNEKLNDFSRQIGHADSSIIPEFVKRSFHSCCTVSQECSHSSETDKLIKQGKVPYLTRTLILELLNVLNWLYDINIYGNNTE